MLLIGLLTITALGLTARAQEPPELFAVSYQWNKLDFVWPDDSFKARFLDSSQYIPENTTISGVKVWQGRMYVTLPRWRRGVPATLASIPQPMTSNHNTAPKLEPFPSWDMQQIGNCTALQNVQNVEIHPNGYMWALDSGRVNIMSDQPDNRCEPKIVVFDLSPGSSASPGYTSYDTDRNSQSGYYQDGYNPTSTTEGGYNSQNRGRSGYNSQDGFPETFRNRNGYNTQNGEQDGYGSETGYNSQYSPQDSYGTQRSHSTPRPYNNYYNKPSANIVRVVTFPDSVVNQDSYLVDIVLDTDSDGYSYISDASESDPGLIVYSWKENRSWKVRDPRSMKADPSVRSQSINGVYVNVNKNIAGLALSPVSHRGERSLYYSPVSSFFLFSIPTSVLRDENIAGSDVSRYVKTLGRKASISEGMVMDSRGVLYYGLLGENAIARWDTNLPFEGNQHKIAQDNEQLQWPSSFGFDSEMGNLSVVSNRLQNFMAEKVYLNEPNIRIITAYTGSKSYLYPPSGFDYSSSTQISTEYGRSFNNDVLPGHDHSEHQHSTAEDNAAVGRAVPVVIMTTALVFGTIVLA